MSVKKRWMISQSIRVKQLAIDFCTDEKSILSKENLFTEYKRLEGRRIFQEGRIMIGRAEKAVTVLEAEQYRSHPAISFVYWIICIESHCI